MRITIGMPMADQLPNGWTIASLKDIVIAQKGKKPAVLSSSQSGGLVPYLDIQAIETGKVTSYAEPASSRLSVGDDILIVWDGARSGWVGLAGSGAIGSTIMAIEMDVGRRYYLYRWLQSQFEHLNTNTRGTGIPHVDPEVFWNLEVPLPPLAEQDRIVAKLEQLLAKVEACQERLNKIPVILKRFRQSVLAAACTGRLTADWRDGNHDVETATNLLLRIKELRISQAGSKKERIQAEYAFQELYQQKSNGEIEYVDIPESWTCCTIGMIGTVCNGSTPSRKRVEFWAGKIPWVSSGEVHNNIIRETREKITESGYESTSVRRLPRGTVLLAMIGEGKTRGQAAILDIEATINQNIAAIILDHGLLQSEYLCYWFQHQYYRTRDIGSGSGPQALNCQRVRELPFVLSPLLEQYEIVRRADALFKIADRIEVRYKKAKAHIDKLTQSILAKAFRGELVPQDPNDEPASVLLERILALKNSDAPATKGRSSRSRKRNA